MKEIRNGVFEHQVKMTLFEPVDHDVIEVLGAIPYGVQSKLIAEAIRRTYRVSPDGTRVVIVSDAAPAMTAQKLEQVEAVGSSKVAKPVKQVGTRTEVDTDGF